MPQPDAQPAVSAWKAFLLKMTGLRKKQREVLTHMEKRLSEKKAEKIREELGEK